MGKLRGHHCCGKLRDHPVGKLRGHPVGKQRGHPVGKQRGHHCWPSQAISIREGHHLYSLLFHIEIIRGNQRSLEVISGHHLYSLLFQI